MFSLKTVHRCKQNAAGVNDETVPVTTSAAAVREILQGILDQAWTILKAKATCKARLRKQSRRLLGITERAWTRKFQNHHRIHHHPVQPALP